MPIISFVVNLPFLNTGHIENIDPDNPNTKGDPVPTYVPDGTAPGFTVVGNVSRMTDGDDIEYKLYIDIFRIADELAAMYNVDPDDIEIVGDSLISFKFTTGE